MSRKLIHIVLIFSLSYSLSQEPSVSLLQGRIVGTRVYTETKLEPVDIYYGIPYATPPIGRHRFSAPERHTGWRRTFQAHRMPPHCPHLGDVQTDSNYSEDCLYLNIWTPRQSDGSSFPVIIILHSESWLAGGIPLPCQDLAAEGLIVVTVQFRLHLLSFFTLGSMLARGNLALLDQYLAILWVRENIAAFGGDPKAITVLGHSAGADSVLYHLSSPRTNGLFQRAIVMSPCDMWKFIDEQNSTLSAALELASRQIALSLGCSSINDEEILHCMQARPLSDILTVYSNTNWSKVMMPVFENYLPTTEQYLPESVSTSSNTNQPNIQVDLLLGSNDLEALNYNDQRFVEFLNWNASNISQYINSNAIPVILRMFKLVPSELLIRAIRWEYYKSESARKSASSSALIELLARIESSAKWGTATALLAARLARRVPRLYVYRYSEPATVDLRGRQFNFSGAVHGSDLISLLGNALMLQVARRPASTNEKVFSATFRYYITNFVKFGYPDNDSKWQRYKVGDAQIFEIHQDDFNDMTASKEVKFWLQYLPEVSNLLKSTEQTEFLSLEKDDYRLRGGIFALCAVAAVLLLMLCASAILLQRQRSRRRFSVFEETNVIK